LGGARFRGQDKYGTGKSVYKRRGLGRALGEWKLWAENTVFPPILLFLNKTVITNYGKKGSK
jgi:hypothetical protein